MQISTSFRARLGQIFQVTLAALCVFQVAQAGPVFEAPATIAPAGAENRAGKAEPPALRAFMPVDIVLPSHKDDHGFDPAEANRSGPLKIGFPKGVSELQSSTDTAQRLNWQALATGGQVAALKFRSPGAKALRLGILVTRLPDAALLRFVSADGKEGAQVTGAEIMALIQANIAAGDTSDEARTYWSPPVTGESVVFEIELPAGASARDVEFSIPRVTHHVATATDLSGLFVATPTSMSCNLDATCYQGTWGSMMAATAKMTYVKSGSSYLCTGTLMNDTDSSSYIPYFLSAYHCIADQTTASSLTTYWFYRSAACGSSQMSPQMTSRSGGAMLLYANANTDTSFLRLNSDPPGGVTYSGWTTSDPTINENVTGIHHPGGDLQKISFGYAAFYSDCDPGSSSSASFSCYYNVSLANSDHITVRYSSGTTEGGSSGSGLFKNNGQLLVGQLHGGSGTSCTTSDTHHYGRFNLAYSSIASWLNPGTPAGYTLNVSNSGGGTVTSSPAGINCGADCSESYAAGTVVSLYATPSSGYTFTGWSGACSGTGSCSVTMNSAQSVTATFSSGSPAAQLLTSGVPVNSYVGLQAWKDYYIVAGPGTLTVQMSGLSADADLYLKAGSLPTRDVYDCRSWNQGTVSENCTLTLASSATVYISAYGYEASSFTLLATASGSNHTLSVTNAGGGTVTSSPSGINCGADCSESYVAGTQVSLIATPSSGYTFAGWGGDCSGTGSCSVTMNSARSVSASFTPNQSGTQLLTSGVPVNSYVGQSAWKDYYIAAGPGTLTVTLSGLSADADLYVRNGSLPSFSSFDCRPWLNGTVSESCVLNLATNATVYISIYGYEASSFTLLASFSGGGNVGTTTAAEFYHPTFNHYFITAYPEEIAMLNSGAMLPWAPTGQTWSVWNASGSGLNPVCRFFSATFAPKSSHFYTHNAAECSALQGSGVWTLEAPNAFYMKPSGMDGSCPSGSKPLYRLYNNGMSGAPNHRYTTSLSIRTNMISQGWIPEGYGVNGVFACIPN